MSDPDELLAAKSKAALAEAQARVLAAAPETRAKAWLLANAEPAAGIALVGLIVGGILGHFIR